MGSKRSVSLPLAIQATGSWLLPRQGCLLLNMSAFAGRATSPDGYNVVHPPELPSFCGECRIWDKPSGQDVPLCRGPGGDAARSAEGRIPGVTHIPCEQGAAGQNEPSRSRRLGVECDLQERTVSGRRGQRHTPFPDELDGVILPGNNPAPRYQCPSRRCASCRRSSSSWTSSRCRSRRRIASAR